MTGWPCYSAAHGSHSAQADAIIDPLITHHAVLEDELKLNTSGERLSHGARGARASIELAYAFTNLLGAELFVPIGALQDESSHVESGLGDIEVQVPKVSFLRRYNWVMTSYLALILPSGSEKSQLGEGRWTFAPHLLSDLAVGRVGLQINLAAEVDHRGGAASEARLSVAHTTSTRQGTLLVSPLVEMIADAPIEQRFDPMLMLVGGLKAAFVDYHVGVGVQVPVVPGADIDFRILAQVGYHVRWSGLFNRS